MSLPECIALMLLWTSTDMQGIAEDARWPKPTPAVRKLVKQLDSDSWKEREQANRKLKKLGWEALAGLKEGLKHPSLEVRVRCERTLSAYFNVWPSDKKDYPKFTQLPWGKEYKLKNGGKAKLMTEDEAKEYYRAAYEKYTGEPAYDCMQVDANLDNVLIFTYLRPLIRLGMDRRDAVKILDEAQKRPEADYSWLYPNGYYQGHGCSDDN